MDMGSSGRAGGPAGVSTDRALLRPHGEDHELHLASVHPGHTIDEVREHLDHAESVGDRVVHLYHRGGATLGQTVDDDQLPQRPVTIE